MKRLALLAPIFVVLTWAAMATPASPALLCPPGVTDPNYCTDVPAVAAKLKIHVYVLGTDGRVRVVLDCNFPVDCGVGFRGRLQNIRFRGRANVGTLRASAARKKAAKVNIPGMSGVFVPAESSQEATVKFGKKAMKTLRKQKKWFGQVHIVTDSTLGQASRNDRFILKVKGGKAQKKKSSGKTPTAKPKFTG